jgi:CHASE2 domain-containing sensor protein
MVTDHEVEQMKRGFVGGGVVIAGVLALAALIATLLGFELALWPLIPLLVLEAVFLVVAIRQRRNGRGKPGR